MSDQRPDDETLGRALGRAVEGQGVRETPYAASRLAQRIDRPARRGWTYALPAVAALALFVAMGAFFAGRGPQPVATPDVSATPVVSATSGPSIQPTAVPASCAPELTRVYFARDQLPPVAGMVRGSCGGRAGVVDQIGGRLTALLGARPDDVPPGGSNATGRTATVGRQSAISTSIRVDGDLAIVEIGVDPTWAARGAAQSQALLQQLIYTITEAPGIRRAQLKDPGKQTFTVDQLVVDRPLSREDVLSYRFAGTKAPEITSGGAEALTEVADWRASVDDVSPGLGRFVVELRALSGQVPQGFVPRLTAKLEPGRNANDAEPGKYVLRLELPDAYWPQTPGEAFHCCPLKVVGKTPVRQVAAYPLGTGDGRPGVGFGIDLDDARPWRVSVMPSPLRVVIDIGGHPDAVSDSVAVYGPRPGDEVARAFTVSGLARAFEGNVSWRVRDAAGRVVAGGFTTASIGTSPVWGTFQIGAALPASVSGNVTLEVFWGSPRDGSDVGLVSIPLQVR